MVHVTYPIWNMRVCPLSYLAFERTIGECRKALAKTGMASMHTYIHIRVRQKYMRICVFMLGLVISSFTIGTFDEYESIF